MKSSAEFIARLLHSVTGAHMLHLMQKGPGSYAAHIALGSLYEGLQHKTDELAEEYFGAYGLLESYPDQEFKTPTDPLKFTKDLYQYVLDNRGKMGKDTHIQNSIDEILKLLSTTAYKLKYLA